MSKHLARSRTRSRLAVVGAVALVAGSVTTASLALGRSDASASAGTSGAGSSPEARTYACAGTALGVVRSSASAATLTCTAGVNQVGRATTSSARSSSTGSAPLPAGTTPGAVLVTTVLTPATSTVAMNGWTKAYDNVSGATGVRLTAWYRTASAGEGAVTATVTPAARVSMITSAFGGARATSPIGFAQATAGTTVPGAGGVPEGAQWVSTLGLGTRYPYARGTSTGSQVSVTNGTLQLAQKAAGSPSDAAVHAGRRASANPAVSGLLSVLPAPAAAVPAGALTVPIGGHTDVGCDGTDLSYRAQSPTVVTVTCARTDARPTPSPTGSTSPTVAPSPSVTRTTRPSPSTTPPSPTTSQPAPTTSTTAAPAPTPTTTAPAPAGHVCTSPVWQTSSSNGMWSEGGYTVHNNMWNVSGYSVSESLAACSHASWNVTATADNSRGDGAVKTYPNVHKDYHDWGTGKEPSWTSFSTLRSTFAAQGSGTGIYDVAYDIWMNGVPGNREIMIWTENHGQRPSGSIVASNVSLSGITWDVWSSGNNSYLAFVPKSPIASGDLDLKAMIDYLVAQGRVPSNSTLGQICFGVEIVSTNGTPATFRFTDFSVTSS